MLEEDCQALLDSIGVLVELLELVEEVVAVRDLEDLRTCDDALHRHLEDEVKIVKLLHLIRQLLINLRSAKYSVQVQPVSLEDGEVD